MGQQREIGVEGVFLKTKQRNKLSSFKDDRSHNVRAWLHHKAEKAGGFQGQRYGVPDFDSKVSQIANLFPGPADNDYVWQSSMNTNLVERAGVRRILRR